MECVGNTENVPTFEELRKRMIRLNDELDNIVEFAKNINKGIDEDLTIFTKLKPAPIKKDESTPNLRRDMVKQTDIFAKTVTELQMQLETTKGKLFNIKGVASQ